MAKKKRTAKAKTKGKGKGKDPTKNTDKGKGKEKKKGKGKVKVKSQKKTKPGPMAKSAGKRKLKSKGEAEVLDNTASVKTPKISSGFSQRRWKQVAGNLGLESHIAHVSRWDGHSTPPVLTGFAFVRHVESDHRDLKCAGTSVNMTQGVIVRREDGKLFLTGRGVTEKYLGIQVPWKNRANAGERLLSAREREELGQPEATGTVSDSSE